MASAATDVRVSGAEGEFGAYRAAPDATPAPGVVVIQEIFGVNAHIRDLCDRLADAGYLALAPDVFHRQAPGVQLGYEGADMQRGFELMQGLDHELALADLGACIDALRADADCSGKVAVMGFCMGGLLAWRAAARHAPDAAVSYYGGGIVNVLGEAAGIDCPILLHFGERDAHIPAEAVQQVRGAVADKPHAAVHTYAADHGFNCDRRGSYDAAAAQLAWQRSLDFLGTHLR